MSEPHSQENALQLENLNETLRHEAIAMAEFALSTGKQPDPLMLEQLNVVSAKGSLKPSEIALLAKVHRGLSRLIAPASPSSITLLQTEKAKDHVLKFLGPVPLVRQLTAFSLCLLILMISVGLSKNVNYTTINNGILQSDGLELFLNLMFLLSCAGLGACFSALYQLNRFVGNANYDPKFDSTYWTKILLGVIAGLFMVELLPPDLFLPEAGNTTTAGAQDAATSAQKNLQTLAKPALALLGGFSAAMVYRVLQRLVDSIESFVKGDPRSLQRANEMLQQAQLEQQKQDIALTMVADLKSLEEKLANGDTQGTQELLRSMQNNITPGIDTSAQKATS